MTVHFWGENPKGLWTLVVTDNDRNTRSHHLDKTKQTDFEDASRVLMDERNELLSPQHNKYKMVKKSRATSPKSESSKRRASGTEHFVGNVRYKFNKRVLKKRKELTKKRKKHKKMNLTKQEKTGKDSKLDKFREPEQPSLRKNERNFFSKAKYKKRIETKKSVIGAKRTKKLFLKKGKNNEEKRNKKSLRPANNLTLAATPKHFTRMTKVKGSLKEEGNGEIQLFRNRQDTTKFKNQEFLNHDGIALFEDRNVVKETNEDDNAENTETEKLENEIYEFRLTNQENKMGEQEMDEEDLMDSLGENQIEEEGHEEKYFKCEGFEGSICNSVDYEDDELKIEADDENNMNEISYEEENDEGIETKMADVKTLKARNQEKISGTSALYKTIQRKNKINLVTLTNNTGIRTKSMVAKKLATYDENLNKKNIEDKFSVISSSNNIKTPSNRVEPPTATVNINNTMKPRNKILRNTASSFVSNKSTNNVETEDRHFSKALEYKNGNYADKDLSTSEKALEDGLVHFIEKPDKKFRVREDIKKGNIHDLDSLQNYLSKTQSYQQDAPLDVDNPRNSVEEDNDESLSNGSHSDHTFYGSTLFRRRLSAEEKSKTVYKSHTNDDKYGKDNSGVLDSWTLILYGTN